MRNEFTILGLHMNVINLVHVVLNVLQFPRRYFLEVYSKWSYGFLDLRSSECTCARKVLVLFQESFNATTIFLQLRHFLLDVFQEVRVGPIKSSIYGFNMLLRSIIAVELTNSSATQNHVVFQPTSEQAKYGAYGILKRNQKASAVFL